MIIKSKLIPKLLSKISGMYITGITVGEFIFIRPGYEKKKKLINHEKIHVAQYRETFYIGFLLYYAFDFIKAYIKTRNWSQSYNAIRLEKEAYKYQGDLNYLSKRKKLAWKNI